MNPMLQAQIGKSESDLVRSVGVPDRRYTTGNLTFIAYDHSFQWANTAGGRNWGFGSTDIHSASCEVAFELDSGVVSSYQLHGDGC